MAVSNSRNRWPRFGISPEKGNEIIGVLLAAVVVLMLLSLLSYHPLDATLFHKPGEQSARAHNWIGPFGAQVAAILLSLLGLTAVLIPALLAVLAWRRLTQHSGEQVAGRGFGMGLVLLTLPALLHLGIGEITWRGEPLTAGGAIGTIVAQWLTEQLNPGGALLVVLTVLLIGLTLAVQSTLGDLLESGQARVASGWEKWVLARAQRSKRQSKESAGLRVLRRHLEDVHASKTVAETLTAAPLPLPPAPQLDLPVRVQQKPGEGQFAVRRVRLNRGGAEKPEDANLPIFRTQPPEPAQQQEIFEPEELPVQELPPVNLLRTESEAKSYDESELIQRGEVIRQACTEFAVEGSIDGISPGPVITVFEFQPAAGVKVSRIVNLQDDLARVLKAESVRIDRIPGRSTLGFEVPNDVRSVIRLGRLLADEKFQNSPSVLTMAVGVDIHGRPYYADLATMPHLLVAGATGAGKSVGLQSMITSILYKATREQVQFIFIDPKRIELGVYADIPHLKTEVVVEPKKAANALRWAVGEMERRYRLLAEVHVRSIDYYNRAIRDPRERQRLSLKEGESEFNEEDFKPLPYYVIIIDELADLMMVSSADVETSIARLAQMARAVGIHLIVATQRPSVDVLTGTIKANFPCRLSYATASRHDSRTILDQVGSERLLGKGDALFMAPGTSRVLRLHGPYISEQETAGLIRWLKRRGKPDLDPSVVADPDGEGGSSDHGIDNDDDLYDEAARLVVAERQASASFLQRRMRVGFSRAARLIDMMAADGLLGPAQGSKPREVLVRPDYFDEINRAKLED